MYKRRDACLVTIFGLKSSYNARNYRLYCNNYDVRPVSGKFCNQPLTELLT